MMVAIRIAVAAIATAATFAGIASAFAGDQGASLAGVLLGCTAAALLGRIEAA